MYPRRNFTSAGITSRIEPLKVTAVRLAWDESRHVNLETGTVVSGARWAVATPSGRVVSRKLRADRTEVFVENGHVPLSLAYAMTRNDSVKLPVAEAVTEAIRLLKEQEGIALWSELLL